MRTFHLPYGMVSGKSSSSSQVAVPQKQLKSPVSHSRTPEVAISSFFVQVGTGPVMNASLIKENPEVIHEKLLLSC